MRHACHNRRVGPIHAKHLPRWVRQTAVSKRGQKGAFVAVVEVDVVSVEILQMKKSVRR